MLIWIVGIVSTLGLAGTIAAVILVPGVAIPILKKVTGAILKCKPCMAALAAIALLFAGALYGIHVERAKCEARIEKMRQAAETARQNRDAEVKADLERTYRPQILTLAQEREALQEKVREYAKRKPVAATPAAPSKPSCKLGDAAGLLRPSKPR
jgi:hypothetical protein